MMTIKRIQLNSRSSIGYTVRSIAREIAVNNLNFENEALKPFLFADELAAALSNGSVSAILDEMPYIKIFLAKYPGDYSLIKTLPTTNGFGFAFPKGSPLVPDISREIVRLRETGILSMLENQWFNGGQEPLTSSKENADGEVRPLTVNNFGGLFLVSGILLVVTYLMYQVHMLYKYWHLLRNWTINSILWRQGHRFVWYLSIRFSRRISVAQAVPMHPQLQRV